MTADRAGLEARYPGGVIPPGTLVRRNPGDPSCQACLDSPDGFCSAHPEYFREPGPQAIASGLPGSSRDYPAGGGYDDEAAVLGPRHHIPDDDGEAAGYDGDDDDEADRPAEE